MHDQVYQKLLAVKRQLESGLTAPNEYKDSYLHKARVYLTEALVLLKEGSLDFDREWYNRV